MNKRSMNWKQIGLLIFVSISFYSYAQQPDPRHERDKKPVKLLGVITREQFYGAEFDGWFSMEYDDYQVDTSLITPLENLLKSHTIMIFMGTWCGDSRREVPRVYKILDAVNYPMNQLKVIGVNNERWQYKKSPGGEEKGKDIRRVPTIIFLKDGREMNRIVESPVNSLEQDMLDIVSGKEYRAKYRNLPVLPVD